MTAYVILYALGSLQPVRLKLFGQFPPLSEAQVLTGKVDVIGHWHTGKSGVVPPKYYINTETGREEFFCGFSLVRKTCFNIDEKVIGAVGSIWLHAVFGVIQHSLTMDESIVLRRLAEFEQKYPRPKTDIPLRSLNLREEKSYASYKTGFDSYFSFERYRNGLISSTIMLIGAIWAWSRYFSRRKQGLYGWDLPPLEVNTSDGPDDTIELLCPFCQKITPKSSFDCIWCHKEIPREVVTSDGTKTAA
jgi:hypothetical protein